MSDQNSRLPDDPFAELVGLGQTARVNAGEVAALNLVNAAIRCIEQLNLVLNAFASAGFDMARNSRSSM